MYVRDEEGYFDPDPNILQDIINRGLLSSSDFLDFEKKEIDVDTWLKTHGERVDPPPKEFSPKGVFVVRYYSMAPIFYVVSTREVFEYFKDSGNTKRWYDVPKALLLPFTNVPMF